MSSGRSGADSIDYRDCAAAPPWHFVTSAPLQIGICSHTWLDIPMSSGAERRRLGRLPRLCHSSDLALCQFSAAADRNLRTLDTLCDQPIRESHRDALNHEFFDLLSGALSESGLGDLPAIFVLYGSQHVFDHGNRRGIHRELIQPQPEQHEAVEWIRSHLTAHRNRYTGLLAGIDHELDQSQQRWMQRFVQIAHVLVRAVDRQ